MTACMGRPHRQGSNRGLTAALDGIQRARYITLETIAPLPDDPFVKLPAAAAGSATPWHWASTLMALSASMLAGSEIGGLLLANLMHFGRTLRAAGLPIGPGKVIDAVAAVTAIGITDRDDFYWTLHAV